jgi:hypothetical protein
VGLFIWDIGGREVRAILQDKKAMEQKRKVKAEVRKVRSSV